MYKILYRILLVISLLLFSVIIGKATIYYVKPTGNDIFSGLSNEAAWGTWQRAFETAKAGDTVYFRGGIYKPTVAANYNNITTINPNNGHGHNGSEGNPVCFFNYPSEKPVLDCSAIRTSGDYNTGINMVRAEYIHFRGLTIKNIYQHTGNVSVVGINSFECANLTFENITLCNLGGRAFYYESGAWDPDFENVPNPPFSSDSTRWLNCDAYNCIDSLGESPGNMADGWKVVGYKGGYMSWTGCRAWRCADDGFDNGREAYMVWENCWAFDIGYVNGIQGNGNGIKTGGLRDTIPYVTKVIRNCIAAWCRNFVNNSAGGLEWIEYQNGGDDPPEIYYRANGRVYNSVFYGNDLGIFTTDNPVHPFYNTVYRNNIAMNSRRQQDGIVLNILLPDFKYPESHNSWDWFDPSPGSWPPYFVETDSVDIDKSDFICNLDSATMYSMLSADRDENGNLPPNPFALTDGSDLIDAGTQIPLSDDIELSLSYYGKAPDMGCMEHLIPVTNISVTSTEGATVIDEEEGTLQLSASVEPSNASNQTVIWSISGGSGQASVDANGLVKAISNGTVTVRAQATDNSEKYGEIEIEISNQYIYATAIDIISEDGSVVIDTLRGTLKLFATVIPANTSDSIVLWSIQNETGEASIDSIGLVTAISNGTVTAIASTTGRSEISGFYTIIISNQDQVADNNNFRSEQFTISADNSRLLIFLEEKDMFEKLFFYNVGGKLLFSANIYGQENYFDISNFLPGIYIAVLKGEKKIKSAKVTLY